MKKNAFTIFAALGFVMAGAIPCRATTILDGSFEALGSLISPTVYRYGPTDSTTMNNYLSRFYDGSYPYIPPAGWTYPNVSGAPKWGAYWENPDSVNNTWKYNSTTGGTWSGGAVAMTEDYTTGWKWAQDGMYFGILQNRSTMSQIFTATENAFGTLTWFDANRNSWRNHESFGRQNSYSVTIQDLSDGSVQVIGNYTSQLGAGSFANSETDTWDQRFTALGKQTWFEKNSQNSFTLMAGRQYSLNFNSLSPTYFDSNGILQIDDRATLVDNIQLFTTPTGGTGDPVPEPGTMGLLSVALLGLGWNHFRNRSRNGKI